MGIRNSTLNTPEIFVKLHRVQIMQIVNSYYCNITILLYLTQYKIIENCDEEAHTQLFLLFFLAAT